MKKILFTILFLICFFVGHSQINKQDLPQYLINKGDTIGVVLSVDQVQKLDNDVELLNLFKALSIKCDSLDKHYIKVINEMNEVITLQEIKIGNLYTQNETLNREVNNLKQAVFIKSEQLRICEIQRKNDSLIISKLKKDLRKSKLKNLASWTSTGLISGFAIFLLIMSGL